MGYNLFVALVAVTILGYGCCGKTKYGPCKSMCKRLKLGKCSKVCRIDIACTIWKSCWTNCKSTMGKITREVLSGCIKQCKVCFVKIVNNVSSSAEGPVFTMDGNFYMVSYRGGEIIKIDLTTKLSSLLVAPSVDGYEGMPTGSQCDHDNNIWVADQRLGLLKVYQNGSFHQIATKDNKNDPIQGFNDLIFDYHGDLWLTASAGLIAPHPFENSKKEPFGSVYCYNITGELIKVSTGYVFPNGIAVQHDENDNPMKLIFGVDRNASLWSFDIVGHCQIENKRLWGSLPANSIPDGMDFDEDGDLIVANYNTGHLYVFGPNGGVPIREIKCPFVYATNVHFRPNSKELYITEGMSNSLWKIQWKSKGMKQYCETPELRGRFGY